MSVLFIREGYQKGEQMSTVFLPAGNLFSLPMAEARGLQIGGCDEFLNQRGPPYEATTALCSVVFASSSFCTFIFVALVSEIPKPPKHSIHMEVIIKAANGWENTN